MWCFTMYRVVCQRVLVVPGCTVWRFMVYWVYFSVLRGVSGGVLGGFVVYVRCGVSGCMWRDVLDMMVQVNGMQCFKVCSGRYSRLYV